MSSLIQHVFHGQQIRTVIDEHGEPWFVAGDVARILGYAVAKDMTRRLDDDEKGGRSVPTPGGPQVVTVITEPGLYSAILGSKVPGAREFKRWVTHELIPAVRRTGSYSATPALTGPELMARALIEAQRTIERSAAEVATLTPRAEAWDVMVSAAGDYSVDEAAKILSRDPGIEIGRNRLFAEMERRGWIYRHGPRNRPHAYQTAITSGRLTQCMSGAFLNARTGKMENPAPTIRVTAKGIDDLRRLIAPVREVVPA